MHVDESEIGELADRVHGDAGKNSVAPLGQHRHQHAQGAIAQGHDQRRGDQPQRPVRRLYGSGVRAGQGVDRPFEGEGHRQGRDLGEQQEHDRPDHAHFQIEAIAGPDIRPQVHERPGQGCLSERIVSNRQFAGGPGRISVSHRATPGKTWRIGRTARFFGFFRIPQSYRAFSLCVHPHRNLFGISAERFHSPNESIKA